MFQGYVTTEYRPISLLNSSDKVVAKVLANRLKECLPGLVGQIKEHFSNGDKLSMECWWLMKSWIVDRSGKEDSY